MNKQTIHPAEIELMGNLGELGREDKPLITGFVSSCEATSTISDLELSQAGIIEFKLKTPCPLGCVSRGFMPPVLCNLTYAQNTRGNLNPHTMGCPTYHIRKKQGVIK